MRMGWRARIGQIRPATAIEGAEEWRRVAPEGVAFADTRTRVDEVSGPGLESMMSEVMRAARELATARVDVIAQCGAPGTFLKGRDYDRSVMEEIEQETGIPGITMTWAMMEALRAVGAGKVAVATIYSDEVNEALTTYMEQDGFKVVSMTGLGFTDPAECIDEEPHGSYDLGRQALREADGTADGLLISCGGYRTFEIIEALERDGGVPVVTSNQATLWACLGAAGIYDTVPGLGHLLADD